MINRTIIRLKIVQLMYAFYQNSGKSLDAAEKELFFSLSKAYDLYNYLLLLMIDVTKFARESIEKKEELNKVAHVDESISHRFIDNRFIFQLETNKMLCSFKEDKKLSWNGEQAYLRSLYAKITESEYYKEYMEMDSVDYAADRELWRKLYKNIIMKDEEIDAVIEEQSLYWNDDKEIVDTFVLKTIKRFDEANGAEQELMPEFRDEEDREFAVRLFRRTITNDEYYRSLIAQNTRNWEFDRLAYTDMIIMQVAIAEILSFPEIPVNVTINEYVELARYYSTVKSWRYVNGILDTVTTRLRDEGKLMK